MTINQTGLMGQLALQALQDPQAFAQLIAQNGIDIGQSAGVGSPSGTGPVPVAPIPQPKPPIVTGTALPTQPSIADSIAKVGQSIKVPTQAQPSVPAPGGLPIQRSIGGPNPDLLNQLIGLLAPSAAPNIPSLGNLIAGR